MAAKISPKTNVIVWAALMALLLATWGISELDLGRFKVVTAITISVAKALLIVLYFMHVRHSPKLVWVFAAAGFVWLVILIELTLSDYLTRGIPWPQ